MSIDWIFGEYKILKKIATGGMAEVFLAKRVGVKGFEKLLAIKRILPQFSENEEFISMFIDEAKLAAQLNHRNIVQIYDFGNQQGSYYIAMEYVFGKDLRTILKKSKEKKKKLSLNQCAYIITEAARGLEYAHNVKDHYGNPLDLIHRDISPQNIFISYEGDVKIADFGIAKAASKSTETRAGVLKGKILYMSPEQAWGKIIDKRSDLYSLGVLLYEMVSDRKIVEADSEFSMLEKVRNAEIEYPSEIFDKLPKRLSDIIKKALEKEPANRYQSAHEMRVDLENFLLSVKETLSEKMISDYLKELFKEEIDEERKILAEGAVVPAEKTISLEPLLGTKTEPREPILSKPMALAEEEPEEKKRGIPILKESVKKSDIRMKVGILLGLFLLAGIVSFYLLIDKPSSTISQVDVRPSSTPAPQPTAPSPSIKIELPKEVSPPPQTVPPQQQPSPSSQPTPPDSSGKIEPPKETSPPETAPSSPQPSPEKTKIVSLPDKGLESSQKREGLSFAHLVEQGPTLLRENKYIKLLEEINQLSGNERQNINIKILESFVYLKKWVLLKDKNAKTHWNNLYNTIEHSGDRSATPILLKIAKDPEEWTRLYAVNLLGSIGDQRALNDLREIASKDPNRRIRRNANNAVSLIEKRG